MERYKHWLRRWGKPLPGWAEVNTWVFSQWRGVNKKPTLGGCEMAQPSQRWSFLPGVPSCLLTSVSFVWVLLHQIPNEVFGCSKRKHRAQNHFAGWNVIRGYPCDLNMRRDQLFTFPLPCTQGHQCLDKSRGMAGTPRETQWTKRWQSQAGTLTFGSKFFFAS